MKITAMNYEVINGTVFSDVTGKDGSVVQLVVSKRKAVLNEQTGARGIISDIGI